MLLADRVRDGSDRYSAGGGRCGALLWVQPRDVARAARVLGAKVAVSVLRGAPRS